MTDSTATWSPRTLGWCVAWKRIPSILPPARPWQAGSMLVAFSVAPLGAGESVTAAVADAVAVVRSSGLPNRTSAMFTEVEGEWEEVMDVVRRATEAVGRHGHRVSLVLKADIRPGFTGQLDAKIERLERTILGD